MKNIIIITGHGNYATGIKSTLELICGIKEGIYFVDFEKGDTDITLKQKFLDIVKDNDVLFVCDLLGGTPYKEATKLAFEHSNYKVTTGCNVGSIMDITFKINSMSINELAETIIESSKKNLMLVDTEIKEEKESTDGI